MLYDQNLTFVLQKVILLKKVSSIPYCIIISPYNSNMGTICWDCWEDKKFGWWANKFLQWGVIENFVMGRQVYRGVGGNTLMGNILLFIIQLFIKLHLWELWELHSFCFLILLNLFVKTLAWRAILVDHKKWFSFHIPPSWVKIGWHSFLRARASNLVKGPFP